MTRTNYDFGPEIEALLADFCVANDDTPKVRVIRKAIKFYIEHRRSEPELAKRMDNARKARMAPQRGRMVVIGGDPGDSDGGRIA